MSKTLASLVVSLQVESAQLRAGLDRANADIKKFSDEAEGGFTILKGAMADLAAEGVEKLLGFAEEGVKSFIRFDQAQRQLAAATGENAEAFTAQAEALRDNLGVSVTSVMHLDMLAARYGTNHGQISQLTKDVLDYSAATGHDASQAMETLLKGVENGGSGLKRMGIAYQSTGDSAKDLDQAMAILEGRFGGAAQVNAESLGGQLEVMKGQMEALGEAFGKFIADVNTKLGVLKALTETFRDLRTLMDSKFTGFTIDSRGIGADFETPEQQRHNAQSDEEDVLKKQQAKLQEAQASAARGMGASTSEEIAALKKSVEVHQTRLAVMKAEAAISEAQGKVDPDKGPTSHHVGAEARDPTARIKRALEAQMENAHKLAVEAIKDQEDQEKRQFRIDKDLFQAQLEMKKILGDADLRDAHILGVAMRKEFMESLDVAGKLWGGMQTTVGGAPGHHNAAVLTVTAPAAPDDVSGPSPITRVQAAFLTLGDMLGGKLAELGGTVGMVLDRAALSLSRGAEAGVGYLVDSIKSAASAVLDGVMGSMGELGTLMSGVMKGFQSGGIWGALAAAISQIMQHAPSFATTLKIVSGIFQQLGSKLDRLATSMQPLIAAIGTVIGQVLDAIAPVLNSLGGLFRALIPWLAMLGPALQSLAPLFHAIAWIFTALAPVLDKLFQASKWMAIATLNVVKAMGDAWDFMVVELAQFAWGLGLNDLGNTIQGLYIHMNGLDKAITDMNAVTIAGSQAAADNAAAQDAAAGAAAKAAGGMKSFSEQIANGPSGWNAAGARYGAEGTGGGSRFGMPPPGGTAAPGGGPAVQVIVHGNVYADDLQQKVSDAVQKQFFYLHGVPA
jgi:hypothetical protein